MPGSPKIVSITIDPVMTPAIAGPRNETSGISAGFIAWRKITSDCGTPLARAIRMNGLFRTSTMLPRIRRAT